MLFLSAPTALASGLTPGESDLIRAVNASRAAHGLALLRLDPRLEQAARFHASDMLVHGYFAHGAFADRIVSFHAVGPVVGENLAWETGKAAAATAIVGAWLRSPEHRANLLRPGYRRIGIGETRGRFLGYAGATVVTADFAGR